MYIFPGICSQVCGTKPKQVRVELIMEAQHGASEYYTAPIDAETGCVSFLVFAHMCVWHKALSKSKVELVLEAGNPFPEDTRI